MATSVSYAELIKMSPKDLESEIRENELAVQKMRVGITMGREKDTARYQRARRQLARMKTALTAKVAEEALKAPKKAATMPAPDAPKAAHSTSSGQALKKAPAKAKTRKTSSPKA